MNFVFGHLSGSFYRDIARRKGSEIVALITCRDVVPVTGRDIIEDNAYGDVAPVIRIIDSSALLRGKGASPD
jgi:hypothetical protein